MRTFRLTRRPPAWSIAVLVGSLAAAGTVFELVFVARYPDGVPWYTVVSYLYLFPPGIALTVVAVAVMRRLPWHPVGWLFGALAVEFGAGLLANGYTLWDLPGRDWVMWLWAMLFLPAYGVLALALLLFPTGRPVGPRSRILLQVELVFVAGCVVLGAVSAWRLMPYPNEGYTGRNPIGLGPELEPDVLAPISDGLGSVLVLLSVVSLAVRWRAATGDERQQVKWLALAALVFGLVASLGVAVAVLGGPEVEDAGGYLIGDAVFLTAVTALPLAIGLAIVRYRLYDIDRLISRTIVFGTLAFLIAGAYVVGVVVIGGAITSGTGAPTLVGLAVTAVVAVAFQPARIWLQARVDRWVYGTRAEPYEVMVAFGRDLSRAVAPEDVLARIAEAAGRAVRAKAARASVVLPGGQRLSSPWGLGAADRTFDVVLAVRDEGETVGEIAVAGGTGRPGDVEILHRLADVSTVAMRNVCLLAELEALYATIQEQNGQIAVSRSRLIAAADEESRHLQSAVADRLGPRLARLRAASQQLATTLHEGHDDVPRRCERLAEQAAELVDEIRVISRGVLPPVLADHGLAAALRVLLRRLDIEVALDVAPSVRGRLPGQIEATAYLCCRAAIEDAEAAGATRLAVRVARQDDELRFSVHRVGGRPDPAAGTAAELLTARDRLTSLGGTLCVDGSDRLTVLGTLPLEGIGRRASADPRLAAAGPG